MTVSNLMTDDDLLAVLDCGMHRWIVRCNGMVLGRPGTLREALIAAADVALQGYSPDAIVMLPNDQVVIDHQQMRRLWKLLGIVV